MDCAREDDWTGEDLIINISGLRDYDLTSFGRDPPGEIPAKSIYSHIRFTHMGFLFFKLPHSEESASAI